MKAQTKDITITAKPKELGDTSWIYGVLDFILVGIGLIATTIGYVPLNHFFGYEVRAAVPTGEFLVGHVCMFLLGMVGTILMALVLLTILSFIGAFCGLILGICSSCFTFLFRPRK